MPPPLGRGDSLGYKKGTILKDGRYKVEREVNRGGSAVVYLAFDTCNHNRKVALKVMDYTNELQVLYKSVKREVAFSAHTNHPNIVQLLDVFADKERRTLVIVWEFVEGPDLLECLNRNGGPLWETEAAFYFCQLLRGLLFMHQTGFAHRDLKPENCVLEESSKMVKLIDFGLTKHIESARTIMVGTPEYMAPELVRLPNAAGMLRYSGGSNSAGGSSGNLSGLEGGGSNNSNASGTGPSAGPPAALMKRYDARKVDAWALGVLFYVLVCAQYPFSDSNRPGSTVAAQRALMAGKYKPLPQSVSQGARRIIQGLLVVDPERRMDLEAVAEDPWLLRSAMEYAAPRGMAHLVEPPLGPPRHQVDAAAAAEAHQKQRRQSGSSRDAGDTPPPVLYKTVTGSSALSTGSNMSDSFGAPADASAAPVSSVPADVGSKSTAMMHPPPGPTRSDIRQQQDQQQQQQQPHPHHQPQQQQQHGYKQLHFVAPTGAPPVTPPDGARKAFEPFAAAAAAAAVEKQAGAPASSASSSGSGVQTAPASAGGGAYYPPLSYDTPGYGFGLAAVKEESGSLPMSWSATPAAPARGASATAAHGNGRYQQQRQQVQQYNQPPQPCDKSGGCRCCVIS